MNLRQLNLLCGFFAHCQASSRGGMVLDREYWSRALSNAGVPESVPSAVAEIAEKRELELFYFRALLKNEGIL